MKGNPSSSPPVGRAGRAAGEASEAEWIRAARKGDREAFGRLVERHQEAVMTAAHYLTGNHEDAADISQEVFLRAYRSLAGFAGHSSFRTWLLTITANASRSLRAHRGARKRTAKEVRIDATGGDETLQVADADPRGRPDGLAMRGELKEALEKAIAELDEESRAALVLRDLAGESYQAVAAALGLALGTVKSRIHRARLELRERLRKLL